METSTYMTTPDAVIAVKETIGINVSRQTIYIWIKKYDLGRKIGGRWYVNEQGFRKFLKEGFLNEKSEEKIKTGKRSRRVSKQKS